MNEKDEITASIQRLHKLEGVLAYCEAARRVHRAQHVQEEIDAETKHLEQLKEEARLDPKNLRETQLLCQCQHCLHHRFWGACALNVTCSKYFGLLVRFEQQCIMEQGRDCSAFLPTNASPYYWNLLNKRRIKIKRMSEQRANVLAALNAVLPEPKKRGKRKKAAKRQDPMEAYIRRAIDNI